MHSSVYTILTAMSSSTSSVSSAAVPTLAVLERAESCSDDLPLTDAFLDLLGIERHEGLKTLHAHSLTRVGHLRRLTRDELNDLQLPVALSSALQMYCVDGHSPRYRTMSTFEGRFFMCLILALVSVALSKWIL